MWLRRVARAAAEWRAAAAMTSARARRTGMAARGGEDLAASSWVGAHATARSAVAGCLGSLGRKHEETLTKFRVSHRIVSRAGVVVPEMLDVVFIGSESFGSRFGHFGINSIENLFFCGEIEWRCVR